jgi:signal transduction histidine kinase
MNETILIVDDEKDLREVLGLSLSDLGYKVFTAKDGEKGLHVFKEVKPTIVLTDIRMPGMDGIELLRKIKREDSDTEVIMITGHGDIDLAIQSLKHEATDFITKPISDNVLEIALNRVNERISMKRKIRAYTESLETLVDEIIGLSHTIKAVAGGLEGGSFVLEKGIELDHREYVQQGWEMLRTSVERIKDLSLGFLNYSKPSPLNCRLVDPNRLVKEVFEIVKSRAEQHGIHLTLELAQDLKALFLDPEGIHRCLLNLATNAIDAFIDEDLSDRRKEIVLKSERVHGWGVEYLVSDNGCGIKEDAKEKIFNSFFTTKGTTGTGVGLMITKKIIDAHHGTIEFESTEGAGTKFIIRLPQTADPTNS